jgi:two-component system, LytTR family, sensor kinase
MHFQRHHSAFTWLRFSDYWFMALAIPMVAFLMPVLFFGVTFQQSWDCFISGPIEAIGFTALFWLGDRFLIVLHRRKFPQSAQLSKRLFRQYTAIFLYTLVVAFALSKVNTNWDSLGVNADGLGFWKKFVACLVITGLVTAIYEAVYFIDLWKEGIAANARLQKENTESQLEALKTQVNPHFLFNSLNTLAGIIPEDPDRAVVFVQKLSAVYRCILELRNRSVITLEEEMECVGNYVYLLQTRFGENLKVDIELKDQDLNRFVVPMAVQMLIENAVKHNVVAQKRPLVISILTGEEKVVVRNPIQPKTSEEPGTGMGLNNMADSLKY